MLNILFIGDINGSMGRAAVAKIVPRLKKELKIDLVVANAENSAHGSGVTKKIAEELQSHGIDWMTNGDHSFKRTKELNIYKDHPIIRPANFSTRVPGDGYAVIEKGGHKILLINLIGRVFMSMDYNCPFHQLDVILNNKSLQKENLSAIIVDIHGECTSEKIALRHYADGRVSGIFGTHTHVMTADSGISNNGTAYITDTGMVGFADGCIGIEKEGIINTFLTQIKHPHSLPETGRAIFNAVLVKVNPKNQKAEKIEAITKFIKI